MRNVWRNTLLCLLVAAIFVLPISAVENEEKNVIFSTGKTVEEDCGCGDSYRGSGIEIFRDTTNTDPPDLKIKSVPDYFNWKDFGGQDWTSPARNQGDCGACWLFAVLGGFESVINIIEGSASIDPDLSEQYVLSCIPVAGSCRGGGTGFAIKYIMDETERGNYHNGVPLEECFPYQEDDRIPCEDKSPDWIDKLVPMLDGNAWYEDNITHMKCCIMEKGPGATDMFITTEFSAWGLIHHNPNDHYRYVAATGANHIVVIVGWKDSPLISTGGYWICKNSWGTDWGYDGFFNIAYGSLNINRCLDWYEYDPESYEWPNEHTPPNTPVITGPISGEIKNEYEYTFNAVDPENSNVRYYISWGDGESEWTGYYSSGEDAKIIHTYGKQGDYSVAALAMNTNDNISPWGVQDVSMPKSKALDINLLFLRFLESHPHLFPILRQILFHFG